jgi:hypothetical protein
MPFGIQTKGFVVGILVAWFLIPWLMGMFNRKTV